MSRKSKGAVKHVDELKLVNDNSIKKLVADAMKIWESEHLAQITALKAEIEELRSSQEFISAKYNDLVTECKNLKIKKLQEQEKMQLKSQSLKLEAHGDKEKEVDAIEQYGQRLNLEISGIPIKDSKNTNKIMEEISKLVNAELSPLIRYHHPTDLLLNLNAQQALKMVLNRDTTTSFNNSAFLKWRCSQPSLSQYETILQR